MKKEMKQAGRLNFDLGNASYCKELKAKTLKGMFAEAQRILNNMDKAKCFRITLTYAIVFAPVPSYAGDCTFSEFTLYDKGEEKISK